MKLAKVLGTVVSTHKEQSLTGTKFLLVQMLDPAGNELPEYEVAADCVGAGLTEVVLVSLGSAARQISNKDRYPVDAMIVAIVDTVALGNDLTYSKRDAS
ncbi:EutN/CcmL family microcompartment protein [Chamaesiphon polymorphus]|uniref:Carboxysome shell vertex protein CcmL n=1 Tax=Chamaesiphon polymorphus CCALA 037 TaxID=2107692 RepID=A0A2T1GBC8_9CYAN|nr:EutN/CcmL family microcompartment protein [Chamaesiphon polymorphus]PSB54615.1 carbon dioxide concentrating mechanism protein CcmL [Chamaesiphon polymorphus CCALA 037]